jgi:hypothetical protein
MVKKTSLLGAYLDIRMTNRNCNVPKMFIPNFMTGKLAISRGS